MCRPDLNLPCLLKGSRHMEVRMPRLLLVSSNDYAATALSTLPIGRRPIYFGPGLDGHYDTGQSCPVCPALSISDQFCWNHGDICCCATVASEDGPPAMVGRKSGWLAGQHCQRLVGSGLGSELLVSSRGVMQVALIYRCSVTQPVSDLVISQREPRRLCCILSYGITIHSRYRA